MARDTLGSLEIQHMLVMACDPKACYSTAMVRRLAELTGRTYTKGTVATTLTRLAEKGYVSSRMGEPTPDRGRVRRLYRLEPAGWAAIDRTVAQAREVLALWGLFSQGAPVKKGIAG